MTERTEAHVEHDSCERLSDYLDGLFHTCSKFYTDVDSIPTTTTPNHWEYILNEQETFKSALYAFSEAVINLRITNAEYGKKQRDIIRAQESVREDQRGNEPEFSAIADQIQRAMASLDIGDHAIIVVRKESDKASEDDSDEGTGELSPKPTHGKTTSE